MTASEAFTVAARTYPKLVREGMIANYEKDYKRADSLDAELKYYKGDLMDVAEFTPEAFGEGMTRYFGQYVGRIYNILKDDLPASTPYAFDVKATEKIHEDGVKEYVITMPFRSPSGKLDERKLGSVYSTYFEGETKKYGPNFTKAFATALVSALAKHGSDLQEVQGGKRVSLDKRRRNDNY